MIAGGLALLDTLAAQFGIERLQTAIEKNKGVRLPLAVTALRDAVRSFEAGHQPADDLTLLLIDWYGQPANEG